MDLARGGQARVSRLFSLPSLITKLLENGGIIRVHRSNRVGKLREESVVERLRLKHVPNLTRMEPIRGLDQFSSIVTSSDPLVEDRLKIEIKVMEIK